MRVHVFQHVPFEPEAHIGAWAISRGHSITRTAFFNSDPIPSVESYDFLVVMGGPMNVYEDSLYPWLAAEKAAIGRAVESGRLVLGVCLGAQLLSVVLGGQVTSNPEKEVGIFPVNIKEDALKLPCFKNFPAEMDVLHWHGDTFSLPEGAVSIASSRACANQGFLYKNRAAAFQFHIEATPESVEAILASTGGRKGQGAWVQGPDVLRSRLAELSVMNRLLESFLDAFISG